MRASRRRRNPSSKRASRRTRKSLLLVFALIFAPAAARQAHAACVEFASPPVITTGADSARDVSTADLDGDGDLDVLSASYLDGEIAWFANDGAGGGWTKTTISTAAASGYAVVAGDLDGDGDLDVVSAAKSGNRLTWYVNDGAGGGWAPQTVSALPDTFSTVTLADADGDGDLDVFSAELGNLIRWNENDGFAGTAWTLHVVRTTADGVRKVVAADVDSDGDTDLLSASDNLDEIAWYENDGAGGGWALLTISSLANSARGAAAADIDGDGDLDALSASFSDAKIAWYENSSVSGDGSTWVAHDVATTTTGAFSVHTADVDGDGDPDVLSASGGGPELAWFENSGNGSAWTLHTISLATLGAIAIFAADVDGDGDTDALSASITDDKIAWYRNDRLHGTALFAGTSTISALEFDARSVGAGDIDGDGDVDALSASWSGNTVAWHENLNGAATTWSRHVISAVASGAISVFAADVDVDGDLDALASLNFTGEIVWYKNLGGGATWTLQVISADAANPYAVVAADVDGDGDLDALSATLLDDRIAWYENSAVNGDGSTWVLRTISDVADGAYGVAAGDVDGDGDIDALSASGFDSKVAWYPNLGGDPIVWTLRTISTAASGPYSVVAADIDSDGDLDALIASISSNTIAWFQNLDLTTPGTGNGSNWTIHTISSSANSARNVFAADVDGDGDTDALSASANDDKIAWYENDGTPAIGAWTVHTVSLTADGARAVFTADLDGDGDADVLSASNGDGKIAWYPNLGTHVHDDGFDSDGATTACWSSSVPPVP